MQKADAIIVLGRGIDAEGRLPLNGIRRVEKAVELWHKKQADYIIMSGKWSYRVTQSLSKTESAAMKEYAISLDVPAENVLCEAESLDTIGNAYFSKVQFLEPRGWYKVIVVSSDDHMERTKYIFNKVLGPSYTIEYMETVSTLVGDALLAKQLKEQRSIKGNKRMLDHITNGDDQAVKKVLFEYVPGYGPDRASAEEKLKELIAWSAQA